MPIDKTNDVVSFDKANVSVLKDVLDKICRDATTVKFVSSTPTADDVREGELVVYDDGTDQKVYIKTAEGTLENITDVSSSDTIVIENRTDDPSSPETGRIWFRTDV